MRQDKPSRTALKVALNLLTLGTKPGLNDLLPEGLLDATADVLLASGAASETTLRIARSPRMIKVYEWFDRLLPGQFEAFAHRKRFCEEQARTGIENGATQILVLGAGYDTLCWRLAPEFTPVTFFEIDHPATAHLKAKGLASLAKRDNLHLIAEDLGQKKLSDVLAVHPAWNASTKTVIIAEGLVMYLPQKAVMDLFLECAKMIGDGSRFAFSYIPTDDTGRLDVGKWTGLMLWLQKVGGEPWLWGTTPERLPGFLKEIGWGLATDEPYMHRKYGVEYYATAIL